MQDKKNGACRKASIDGSSLTKDIGTIADAVIQLYKNIEGAISGKAGWRPNGLPNYRLVLTLEDWYLFGPKPQELLKEAIEAHLCAAGMDAAMMNSMPYAIASSREFERFSGVVKAVGINAFFAGKNEGEYRTWMWAEYWRSKFPDSPETKVQALFRTEWLRVVPTSAIPDEVTYSMDES